MLLPKVKLKVVPTFPADVIGGTGLTTTKANGSLTIDYAWQEFGTIDAIPTQPTAMILTYDTAQNSYIMVPSHLLGGAVSGIADAPTDGSQYGRQTGSWTLIPGSNPASNPPIVDGVATVGTSLKYAREDHIHPSDPTKLGDAPSNGTLYGRLNGAWSAVTVGGGGITEAPTDGAIYARKGQTAAWIAALPLAGGTLTGPLTSPGSFTPATPDGAAFIAKGSFGGGFTFQDGVGRGAIFVQNTGGDMLFETGQTVATLGTRLTLSSNPAAAAAINGYGTATTPTAGDSSTKLATTAFVQNALVSAGIPIFNTRNAAIAATIAAGVTYIRINGYSTVGDGGGFDAKEVVNSGPAPVDPSPQFLSNGGTRRWQIVNTVINPRMFGGVGDGTNDDTASLQACIDMRATNGNVSIYIPPVGINPATGVVGAWRTTGRLNISASTIIHGDGIAGSYLTFVDGSRRAGSWILFDHLDVGFNINSGAELSHVVFDGINTLRNQPAPVSGWAPIGANYDFYCLNADVMILNAVLLNPTLGVYFYSDGGRLTMTNVRGQPFQVCINIERAFDCCRLTDIHWWIYWSSSDFVNTYTVNHRLSLRTARADGLFVLNYLSIFDLIGHSVYSAAGLPATANSLIRAKLINCYFDQCGGGVQIDSGTGGVIIEYVNLLIMWPAGGAPPSGTVSGAPNGHAFLVNTSNAEIYVVNFEIAAAGALGVLVQGTGNHVALHNPRFRNWGINLGAGAPAISCDAGNYVKMTGDIAAVPGVSSTFRSGSGIGNITGELAKGMYQANTDGAGNITISHGARVTPSYGWANVPGGVANGTAVLVSINATNVIFSIRSAGAALPSAPVLVHWEVHI